MDCDITSPGVDLSRIHSNDAAYGPKEDAENPNILRSSYSNETYVCVTCDSYFAAESLFCWHNFEHLHKPNKRCCTDCPVTRVAENFASCKMTISILKLVKHISKCTLSHFTCVIEMYIFDDGVSILDLHFLFNLM